ncbi:MAG: sigma-70 family RNA polymerase sigma factor [Armatimonadetes bacterium]|nr:sigma-70 family RNA polymerase sigma factor [Armatimonadota bacterium]
MSNDEILVKKAQNGDYGAFEALVERYEAQIYNLSHRMLRHHEDAEDVLQKTFLSVFTHLREFRGESRFSTWLFRIATNHALMKLRKDRGLNLESLDGPVNIGEGDRPREIVDWSHDVTTTVERRELRGMLDEAISGLPEIYRIVFLLRDVEGFSTEDVAQILQASIPAIKSRLLRARLQLREALSGRLKETIPR